MKLITFGRDLSQSSFERAWHGASPFTKSDGGWTEVVKREGLRLDLRRVEFAEFGTLAQLALVVEGALRHGIAVKVLLPLVDSRAAETDYVEREARQSAIAGKRAERRIRHRVTRRRQARHFMEHAGFIRVLSIPQLEKGNSLLHIVDEAADDTYEAVEVRDAVDELDEEDAALNYRFRPEARGSIFPLSWFPAIPEGEDDIAHWQSDIAAVLYARGLALTEQTANAIATAVLYELIDNVYEHAGDGSVSPPLPLVGAIVLNLGDTYELREARFSEEMAKYLKWARDQEVRLVRLIVGDSGIGVPATLRGRFQKEHRALLPNRELTEPERLLFFSLTSASSRHQGNVRKRGVRGLARVARFARTFRGAVLMRGEDALVGWTYADRIRAPFAESRNLRMVPGTLVDAFLLSPQTRRGRASVIGHSEVSTSIAVTRLRFRNDGSIISDYLVPTGLSDSQSHCTIALMEDLPGQGREGYLELPGRLHEASTLAASQGSLVVVATTLAQQVESIIQATDDAREEQGEDELRRLGIPTIEEPVMLLDATGTVTWFGATGEVRRLLYELCSQPEGELSAERVLEIMAPLGQAMGDLEAEFPDWLAVTEAGRLALRVTPEQVERFVVEEVRRRLKAALYVGRVGVIDTSFWTPTLFPVNRWIRVAPLVKDAVGLGNCAYAMARVVDRALDPDVLRQSVVVALSTVGRSLAKVLTIALGLGEAREITSALGVTEPVERLSGFRGKKVILISDLVVSENTAYAALADLIRAGAEPVILAIVVDARTTSGTSIKCMGRRVPTCSLVDEVELVKQVGSPDAFIDPLLGEDEAHDLYAAAQDELLEWSRLIPGLLYLGHVERSIGRHFTSYLDVGALMAPPSPQRDAILQRFEAETLSWLKGVADGIGTDDSAEGLGGEGQLEVWYPGEEDDFAGRIAVDLERRLKASAAVVVNGTRALRRLPAAGRWIFSPDRFALPNSTDVLIVDWGSITATTVQQMLRSAARSGARSIKAIIFTSQLTTEEEDALQRIRVIRGERIVGERSLFQSSGAVARDVPVSVIFFSSLRMGLWSRAACPLCRLRSEYRDDMKRAPARLLRQHAELMSDLLGPVGREELLRREPTDLYGERISAREATSVLEWRILAEKALISTRARRELQIAVEQFVASGSLDELVSFVRFISFEPVWLSRPPLRYLHLRRVLADGVVSALREPLKPIDGRIRVQMIVGLRALSKSKFLDLAPTLLRRLTGDSLSSGAMLHGIYKMLDRDYLQTSPAFLEDVLACILECRSAVEEGENQDEADLMASPDADILSCLGALQREAEFLLAKAKRTLAPKEAWRLLKVNYQHPMESHSETISAIHFVLAAFEGGPSKARARAVDPGKKPTAESWASRRTAWQQCSSFIAGRVMPYLPPLREILQSHFYEIGLPASDLFKWDALVGDNSSYPLDQLDLLLAELQRNPLAFDEAGRAFGESEAGWWFKFLLDAGPGREEPSARRAHLLRLLRECPCDTSDAIEEGVERARAQGLRFRLIKPPIDGLRVKAFVPRELLAETVAHALQNAAGGKHARGERSPEGPRVEVSIEKAPKGVHVYVVNDETQTAGAVGKGLGTLRERLRPFRGAIHGMPRHDDWTYELDIQLDEWVER